MQIFLSDAITNRPCKEMFSYFLHLLNNFARSFCLKCHRMTLAEWWQLRGLTYPGIDFKYILIHFLFEKLVNIYSLQNKDEYFDVKRKLSEGFPNTQLS